MKTCNFTSEWLHEYRVSVQTSRPQNLALLDRIGCDIVVFLVFNEFTSCAGGGSDGHQFSGIAEGGACEGTYGSGYVIAVDQGSCSGYANCRFGGLWRKCLVHLTYYAGLYWWTVVVKYLGWVT